MVKKLKILYAEDLDELREIYSMAIEAQLNCEVVEFSNGNSLIEYLKSHSDAAVVLCDHNMPNGNGSEVYRFIKKSGNKVPFGLLSSDDYTMHAEFQNFLQDHPFNFSEVKPFNISELMKKLSKALHAAGSVAVADYVPVRMDRLERFSPLIVDAYIKVDEQTYVKLLSVGDYFSKEHHGKHQEKYGKFLYVLKDQYLAMLDFYLKKLKIDMSPALQVDSLALVHEYVNALGMDPKVVAAVNSIYESVIDNFKKKNGALSTLVSELVENRGYLYEHSLLLGYVCCGMAGKSIWSGSNFYKKFVTAALLHDLGLDDETSRIDHYSSILEKNLSWEISKKVTEHSEVNYQTLGLVKDLPEDVQLIVLCHHERPNGKGFPKGLVASNTAPIACLFIIAEEFVSRIVGHKPDSTFFQKVCQGMESEFSAGNYKKPYEALRSLLAG